MKDWLIEVAKSKKVAATVVSILMTLFGSKLGLDPDSLQNIVYALIAYVVGQGVADHGKEAAKVKA